MVVNNPNNWHWVDKNVFLWSKAYLTEKLTSIKCPHKTADGKDVIISVDEIKSITGDSDLSQRKGKAIVIYDMLIEFNVKGTSAASVAESREEDESEETKDETVFETAVEIPEFIHDMDDDDYQFEFKNKSLNLDHKNALRKQFFPLVVKELQKYQNDVIEEHSKDLKHFS